MERGQKISLAKRFNKLLDPVKTRIVVGKCPIHNVPLRIGIVFVSCPKRSCDFSMFVYERDEIITLMSNG